MLGLDSLIISHLIYYVLTVLTVLTCVVEEMKYNMRLYFVLIHVSLLFL